MVCSACTLANTRRCITKGLGSNPVNPDILFILESPTKSGEIFGRVMARNEESFLAEMYRAAMRLTGMVTHENWGSMPGNVELFQKWYAISLVQCRATDEKHGANRPPEREEILACMPRLMARVLKIKPKGIIFASRVVEKFLKKEFPEAVYMLPPEFLLKQGAAHSPWYSTNVRTIAQYLNKLHGKVIV